MNLDKFVPVGRPQSGTVIMQLMTELDVPYNYIPEPQYQNRLESKAIRYFFRKVSCHNAIIFENILKAKSNFTL